MFRTIAALFGACLIAAAGRAADSPLPGSVVSTMERYRLGSDSLSLYVADPERGEVLLSHRIDEPRNPASVMKLVTAYAALDLLGPAYTWHTDFFSTQPIRDGVLDGDLFVRGGGDPMILVEDFLRMLFQLRQRGLREIRGNLVVDNSVFDETSIDTQPLDDQPTRAYNAYPASLVVNFRATRFVFVPRDGRIDIIADPPSSTLAIDNRLEIIDGPCRSRHRAIGLAVSRRGGTTTVTASGRYPRSCGEYEITRTVLSQDDYLLGVFDAVWAQLGGTFHGRLETRPLPADARPLLEHVSHSLAAVLEGMNKFSNNLMARSLLLTLGAETYGEPGSVDLGRVAVRDWLNARGIPMPGLVMVNGAGLSRDARLTAGSLGALLEDVLSHPFREEYLASLSLVGIDGSTRKRLRDGSEAGRYRLKTGLLDGVRAAAGFGLTERGTRLVIVIIQNADNLTYASGNAVQDSILGYLHRHY